MIIPKNNYNPRTIFDENIVDAICKVYLSHLLYSGKLAAKFRPTFIPSAHWGGSGYPVNNIALVDMKRDDNNEFCDEGTITIYRNDPDKKFFRFDECDLREAFRRLIEAGYYMMKYDGAYYCSPRPYAYNGRIPYERVTDFEEHFDS